MRVHVNTELWIDCALARNLLSLNLDPEQDMLIWTTGGDPVELRDLMIRNHGAQYFVTDFKMELNWPEPRPARRAIEGFVPAFLIPVRDRVYWATIQSLMLLPFTCRIILVPHLRRRAGYQEALRRALADEEVTHIINWSADQVLMDPCHLRELRRLAGTTRVIGAWTDTHHQMGGSSVLISTQDGRWIQLLGEEIQAYPEEVLPGARSDLWFCHRSLVTPEDYNYSPELDTLYQVWEQKGIEYGVARDIWAGHAQTTHTYVVEKNNPRLVRYLMQQHGIHPQDPHFEPILIEVGLDALEKKMRV